MDMRIATMAVVLLLPAAVLAQEAQDPAARLAKARELADGGRLAEAMKVWEDVVGLLPEGERTPVHLELAKACRKFGRLAEAWYHFDKYIRTAAQPVPEATTERETVEKALARTHCRVDFSSEPAGAVLHFDETGEGPGYATPFTFWVKPGMQMLTGMLDGYEMRSIQFASCAAGSSAAQKLTLTPLEQFGVLQLAGQEIGAEVFLNGRPEGTIPFRKKVAAGTWEVVVSKPGRPAWRAQIVVPAGGTVVERPDIPKSGKIEEIRPVETGDEGGSSWWKWAMVGGGVALVGVGGTLNGMAYTRNEDLKKKYPDGTLWNPVSPKVPALYQQEYDNDVQPMATGAWILYGVGGAAAVAGAVLLIVDAASEPGKATVVPLVDGDVLGMSATFSF